MFPFLGLSTLILSVVLTLPLMTRSWAADPLPLEQLLAKMQETYEGTKDLTATFVQELTLTSLKKTQREEGTVHFKNPGRMLWEYTRPKSKKFVVNPQKAWLYVPEDRVVYVHDAQAMHRSKLVIRFLSGIGSFRDDFQVSYASPEATDREGHYRLVLIPKQKDLGTDRIDLTVERNSFQIVQCHFSDDYDNLTRIRFRNIRINRQLPDSLFHFSPPRGVEIFNVAP